MFCSEQLDSAGCGEPAAEVYVRHHGPIQRANWHPQQGSQEAEDGPRLLHESVTERQQQNRCLLSLQRATRQTLKRFKQCRKFKNKRFNCGGLGLKMRNCDLSKYEQSRRVQDTDLLNRGHV